MNQQMGHAASGYSAYWGKAQPDNTAGAPFHPLPYHCLDVAAVALELVSHLPLLERRLSALLQLRSPDLKALLALVVGLHDIGKFSLPFQAKRPDLAPAELRAYLPASPNPRHDEAGLILWHEWVADALQLHPEQAALTWLVRASVGHHGEPVNAPWPGSDASRALARPACAAAVSFASDLLRLVAPARLPIPAERHAKIASWAVAGLTTLADWIGSNQIWFPYHRASYSLERYWTEIARPAARRAVVEAGVIPAQAAVALDLAAMLGQADHKLRPMQRWAQTNSLPTPPALFLIEDVTGSGKTEAALILAHRLMAAGRASGLFIGLPTQATANAMFERLAGAHRALFAASAAPSIALVHGKREMHPGFRAAKLAGGRVERSYGTSASGTDVSDVTASAQCAAWIADDRRLAFLADIGAGTVDQALLGILTSRHQSLRLLGLMQRMLVIDEVHAYDPFVRRELAALLRFHAAFGGDAVLLSATLPAILRAELVTAFAAGAAAAERRAAPVPKIKPAKAYPLVTAWSRTGVAQHPLPPDPSSCRRVVVQRLARVDDAIAAVRRTAEAGATAIYFRNTVRQALEAYAQLAELQPLLFHARFALADRLMREREVVQVFGKQSGPNERTVMTADGRRLGRILVATQVAEQSLDLDFDIGVSDLAPVDLLIQRAGRIWRHVRPDRIAPPSATSTPQMLILSPDPDGKVDKNWAKAVLGPATAVYEDSGRLWLTAHSIFERGVIDAPEGLRPLIEAVYAPDAETRIPEALRPSHLAAVGKSYAEQGEAAAAVLKLADGYSRAAGNWDDDARVVTRLGEPRTTFRLAVMREGRVVPWALREDDPNGMEPWVAWRLSEVDVYAYRVAAEAIDQDVPNAALTAARESWARWDTNKVLILLHRNDATDSWGGSAVDGRRQPVRLSYHPNTGLQFAPNPFDS